MSDKKISQLTASTTPLAGTEVLPVVQSGITKQVSIDNLTAGRNVATKNITITNSSDSAVLELVGGGGGNAQFTLKASGASATPYYCYMSAGRDFVLQNFTQPKLTIEQSTGNYKFEAGNLVIGTAGKGIDFSADGQAAGMTSELLDDYEEGTWTPAQGSGLVVVGDFSSSGTYTKIGRQVTVSGRVQGSTTVALGAGGLITNNLPFATSSSGTGAAVDSTATKGTAIIAYSGGSFQVFSAEATTPSAFVDFSLTYFV